MQATLIFDPATVQKVVTLSRPPKGSHDNVYRVFNEHISVVLSDLQVRAIMPIREIAIEAARYEHAEGDLTAPLFENGYPVILILMNGVKVAFLGVTFSGNSGEINIAEVTGSKLLLAPE
ncbi:MAG: hypothetical protein GOVbin52_63 [Prokaryotic dsDNA virus sp.]|mgnify:FL=1|nr:MAG: hypothetical protein GOVbin52_63 [Prokaryotic dsDNA virus sp.]HBX95012.1 hypothetical protein [Hyphomonas sp.]|tara:strand:+ start:7860 stop:8219 length:360 start_codon:yes stop_codon:yes gene_type:complete